MKKLNAAVSQLLNPEFRTNSSTFDEIIYEINTETEKDEFTKEIEVTLQGVAKLLKPKIKFE